LCAFAISAPLESTTHTIEEQKIERIIEAISQGKLGEDDLIKWQSIF
jgi:hypothetical protein